MAVCRSASDQGQNGFVKMFRASVLPEGDLYVAQCLDVDVAGQGDTEDEALEALKEALQLHFTPLVATVVPKVATLAIEVGAA
jgi:hypothetical protein